MTRWGAEVVGWLELAGGERVLDAGCGTGKVTAMLLSRLPRGSVVALDGSPSMIETARRKLRRFGGRVEFVVADLQERLPISPPVDAVLSTATFHWIPDHDRLFMNLAGALRPGGQLVAQCGGQGNIATVEAALRAMGREGFEGRKHFASVDGTRERLERAGFAEVEVWQHDEPTPVPPEDLEAYLETICLGDVVAGMSAVEAAAFANEVASRLPGSRIDYVRLNMRARRR